MQKQYYIYSEFTGGSSCVTESGPDTGSPCIFPFSYNGVTYTECLASTDADYYIYFNYYDYYYDNLDGTWCSTQVLSLYENKRLQAYPHNICRWTVMVSM